MLSFQADQVSAGFRVLIVKPQGIENRAKSTGSIGRHQLLRPDSGFRMSDTAVFPPDGP